jgi:DNA-directed RNA polymerase subunit beta'
MSQLLDMVFSPDDTILIGGEDTSSSDDSDEVLIGDDSRRRYNRSIDELDSLLESVGGLGFGIEDSESTLDDEE